MPQIDPQAELEAYKNLDTVLEDEIKVYRALLDLVRREKEVLISARIDDLNDTNRAKEAMLMKIKALDRSRESHAKKLAAVLGLKTENPRLLELAGKMIDPASTKLRSIHATLDLLVRRIREINEGNETLVRSSLRAVSGALGAIKHTLAPKPTYASSGEVKNTGEMAGHFVSKEA